MEDVEWLMSRRFGLQRGVTLDNTLAFFKVPDHMKMKYNSDLPHSSVGQPAPEAGIIPLDQTDTQFSQNIINYIKLYFTPTINDDPSSPPP